MSKEYKDVMLGIPMCTRNNLDYLKLCMKSLKEHTKGPYAVYLYLDDCTDGTKEWLDEINHKRYHIKAIKENKTGRRLGLTNATNKVMAMVEEDVYILIHSDMYFMCNWDVAFRKQIKSKRLTCLTRVEPEIFPPEPCKVTEGLGNFPDDFDEMGFKKYSNYLTHKGKKKLGYGQFAPYGGLTKEWLKYGVDGNLAKQSHEETDMYYRMMMDGFDLRQTWESYVYHFGGRGDRFKDKDLTKFDDGWSKVNIQAIRNFIRKWGQPPILDKWSYPKLPSRGEDGNLNKMSLCVLTKNEGDHIYNFLHKIEPFFQDIVIVDDKSTDGTVDEINRYIKETKGAKDGDGKPMNYYFNPKKIQVHTRALSGDFSSQKNFAISKAKHNYIFHLDVDEEIDRSIQYVFHDIINGMESSELRVVGFPRINIIDGKQTEVYPDVQFRFHHRDVRWVGEVHEHPELIDGQYTITDKHHIIHSKTSKRHNERNTFYNTIKKGAGNLVEEKNGK